MNDLIAENNAAIELESPAVAAALSALGRRSALPDDVLTQAAEASRTTYNGTIGVITDGNGNALPLPSIAEVLSTLPDQDLNRALLYSKVLGLPEVRQAWQRWQRRNVPESKVSSLPVVTDGLSHGLSLCADLFGGEGRVVVVPAPYWGNYNQVFGTRTGTRMVSAPSIRAGRFRCEVIEDALADVDLADQEPVVAILHFPSNPGGYSLTANERMQLRTSLLRIADQRPLVVVCDDAYAGLVYEEAIPRASIFWDLAGIHSNLIPIKVDGVTKEFSFFGGRVGFLTFPFATESALFAALERKLGGLIRSTVGSPVAATQMIVLQALRRSGIAGEVESVRKTLEGRYRVLKEALEGVDASLLRPHPFNSGCFALVELPEELGLESGAVRRHLLENHDTGLVSLKPRYLRIAHCSVDREKLPELVSRLEKGVRELLDAK
jgi:aspartate/methionine/tyrosine aminotransferase